VSALVSDNDVTTETAISFNLMDYDRSVTVFTFKVYIAAYLSI
jgi:hypothetical protein